jgi:hypothetical protein
MIKTFLQMLIVCFLLHSCKREKVDIIDAPDPIKQLIRNMDTGGCVCEYYVDRYLWKGDTIYVSGCQGRSGEPMPMADFCDCMRFFYNKNAERITLDSNVTAVRWPLESRLINRVWKCKKR